MTDTVEGIAFIYDFIAKHGAGELADVMADEIARNWDEYQAAKPEDKARMIGNITSRAAMMLIPTGAILKVGDIVIKSGVVVSKPKQIPDLASNPIARTKLFKQLASEKQMREVGIKIAGPGSKSPFRNSSRVANKYGSSPGDYVKKASSSVRSPDGQIISTHWLRILNQEKNLS